MEDFHVRELAASSRPRMTGPLLVSPGSRRRHQKQTAGRGSHSSGALVQAAFGHREKQLGGIGLQPHEGGWASGSPKAT